MAITGVGLTVHFGLWDVANSAWKTGDAANLTMYVTVDGVRAEATNAPAEEGNGIYSLALTDAEVGACTTVDGTTVTADCVVIPTTITTADAAMRGTDGAELSGAAAAAVVGLAVTGEAAAAVGGLHDFDPTSDTVAHVALVDTTTANTDMRGTDNAALATSLATVAAGVLRVLGLVQENQYIDNVVTDSRLRMTSARLRTYSAAGSVGTANDVLATYTITATYTGTEEAPTTYKVVKA